MKSINNLLSESESAATVDELFGTLQDSIIAMWRKHLATNKYSEHMALDEYYKEMPELVDSLIESYIGAHEKPRDYKCIFDASGMTALQYLGSLKNFCLEGRKKFFSGESDLESLMDNILSFINGIMYKLKELS